MKSLYTASDITLVKKGANFNIMVHGTKLFATRDEKKARHQFENNMSHWVYWANSASVSVQEDFKTGNFVKIIARGV